MSAGPERRSDSGRLDRGPSPDRSPSALPFPIVWLLRRFLPATDADVVLGDLAEEARRRSVMKRPLWLARQALSLLVWNAIDRAHRSRDAAGNGAAAPGRATSPAACNQLHPALSPRNQLMSQLLFDTRTALRGLKRSPGFALAMVATVALGVGGTTTVFALAHGVLLAPLEYPRPDRLVAVWPSVWASKSLFRDVEGNLDTLEGVAAWSGGARVLQTDSGDPELLLAPEVSAGFLDILGYRPVVGRFFRPADNLPGAAPVVVLTHELFATRFGANEDVVGRTVRLDGESWTVIGVLPANARLLQPDASLVTPLRIDPDARAYRTATYLQLLGRLRDDVALEQASAEVRLLAASLQGDYGFSDAQVSSAGVVLLQEHLVGDRRPLLSLLMGAVLLVLLAAAVNAGSLTLARQLSRRTELAVRTALGSGRARALAFLGAESILLALAGGIVGALLASWILDAVRTARPLDLPRLAEVQLNATVLLATVAATAITALTAGLLPALRATRVRPADALRTSHAMSPGRRTRIAREGLVVIEVTLAVVLAVGATLMARSLWDLSRVDPGFETENRLLLQLVPPALRAADFDMIGYYERVIASVGELPSIESAAAVNAAPVRGGGWVMGTAIEGVAYAGAADQPLTTWRVITPGYFETLGARLLRGRPLRDGDGAGNTAVAVVNETFARSHWPDGDALGKRFRIGWDTDEWLTVVGVVADIRLAGVRDQTPPTAYRPLRQAAPALARVGVNTQSLIVHTRGEPLDALDAIGNAVHGVDPSVALVDPSPMSAVIRASVAEQRLLLQVLVAFAATALLLSAVGLAGIVANLVRERRREFGIRQALGASPARVVGSSLLRGVALGAVGIAIGTLAALALGPLLQSFLFGVSGRDPLTLGAVVAILGACVLLASWVPSRRAGRIDPSDALRL